MIFAMIKPFSFLLHFQIAQGMEENLYENGVKE